MLKKSFARLGPAPQRSQVIDLPLWGGAMRCQRSIRRDFFSSLLDHFQHFCGPVERVPGGASFSLQPRLQPRPSK
jgi:hypothetical protein